MVLSAKKRIVSAFVEVMTQEFFRLYRLVKSIYNPVGFITFSFKIQTVIKKEPQRF